MKNIIKKINSITKKPTYLVGGAVRDFLLGQTPHDLDFVVVGATKKELITAGGKYIDAASAFPVFHFEVEGEKYEVAMARREAKDGLGYKGFKVEASPDVSLEEDLERRDFTINSMAMDKDGRIIDPFGGEKDLREKVLKATNNKAFSEDPLRVIRACRFAAKLKFKLDGELIKLGNKVPREDFENLPMERFVAELNKALNSKYPAKFFESLLLFKTACEVFFPQLNRNKDYTSTTPNDPETNLAVLFYRIHNYENVPFFKYLTKRQQKIVADSVKYCKNLRTNPDSATLIQIIEALHKNGTFVDVMDLVLKDPNIDVQGTSERACHALRVVKMNTKELGIDINKLKRVKPGDRKNLILQYRIKAFNRLSK